MKFPIKHKKKYAVYILICPIKKCPIYVGCSGNISLRYLSHIGARDSSKIHKYIREHIHSKGENVSIKIIKWKDHSADAFEIERQSIWKYRYQYKYFLLNRKSPTDYNTYKNSIYFRKPKIKNLLK